MLRPVKDIFDNRDFPDLLIGLDTPDDAAVWKLDEHRALVLTTDFFTPVVDNPYDYGAIAAANSLSDIYAMGGKPFVALNIAALPPDLPTEIASEIFRGGAEKSREAGVVVAGGHTIQDKEPKYGLIVLGFVDPALIFTKNGARPGDRLILTKPLGFGVTTTALKRQEADSDDVVEAVGWMSKLNDKAAALGREFGVRSATDITGFSLLGHAHEMAAASGVRIHFSFEEIPFISCGRKYADRWTFPGGAADNRLYFQTNIQFHERISETEQMMLFDPQTSGGLLLAVPDQRLESFLERAKEIDQPVWPIGEVTQGTGIFVD